MGVMAGHVIAEGDTVALDRGGDVRVLEYSIVAFLGPSIVLRPVLAARLTTPDAPDEGAQVYLLVPVSDGLRALAGSVRPLDPPLIVFEMSDSFSLGQRRWWSRAPVVLRARLEPRGGGPPPTDTETVDVSPGGVKVKRQPGMPVWPRYTVVLSGDLLGEPLTAEAVPARAEPSQLGLRFTDVAAQDQQRLAALVLAHLQDAAGAPDA